MTRRIFLTSLLTLLATGPAVKAASGVPDYVIGTDVATLGSDRTVGHLLMFNAVQASELNYAFLGNGIWAIRRDYLRPEDAIYWTKP